MRKLLASASVAAMAALLSAGAYAQEGTVAKAVGGYTFEEAAKEAPETKDFHSADGHLTFAVITHTAGNGFFDPVYVGATVAGNMIGAKILLLGSESPTDDPQREIEILNQIVQDPTIDGLIMTTPQVGAYNDIVKAAEKSGIPVATTNSFDDTIHNRSGISHTGQDASAAAIGGAALAKCVLDKGIDKGSIVLPSSTAMGNIEVNNRVTAAFNAIVKTLNRHTRILEQHSRILDHHSRVLERIDRGGGRHPDIVVARHQGFAAGQLGEQGQALAEPRPGANVAGQHQQAHFAARNLRQRRAKLRRRRKARRRSTDRPVRRPRMRRCARERATRSPPARR